MRKAAVAMGGKGTATSTDLLVCFPARQRLALMLKPISNPSHATMDKAAARRRSQTPGARSSPMFRGSKAQRTAGDHDEEEPQSPKVTCAGQIKVGRHKKKRAVTAAGTVHGGKGARGGGKSWITVVEEIARMHGRRKKAGRWLEAVGVRRHALPFLGGVLPSLRLKARCLVGSLHGAAVDSSTDDEDDGGTAAASVFSKWLMVLERGEEEPLEQDSSRDDDDDRGEEDHDERQNKEADERPSAPLPPNALLFMRCRSAPATGLSLSRRETAEPPAGEAEEKKGSANASAGAEEDRDDLMFMSTAPGFLKLSIDIAKGTWLGGSGDPLSRSRSWKR
jgi:hypothetical protein